MTAYEIVEILAKQREVEKMIKNISNGRSFDPTALDDLAQDIYMSLLNKGEKLIEVYEQGHINFYLSRIVCNNIISSTSQYYRRYILPQKNGVGYNDKIMSIPDGE